MRQFLAVTVLLALISAPAAFFLGGIPASAVNAVSAEGAGKGATIIAALQRVAVGLAASLAGTREEGDPLQFTAAAAAEDDPAASRIGPAPAGAILATVPSVIAAPDRFRWPAGVAYGGGAAIALAAMNPGRRGLARDYPTAFLWFVLA